MRYDDHRRRFWFKLAQGSVDLMLLRHGDGGTNSN
ncbi:hypothetical protein Pcac1_g6241 [Phytophthora cactorum]|uniref:Uncharacterized protein n=1 Tax=Phytophthora cactorum TaxID=29920 RepID=A0A8T1D8H5_9STRA|nr:hypothetical protein Pcac1_g6241 [Phytophthora cactorum]KAG2899220.1 hypothetical protein PC114_g13986 [Phytophthora cactorum]KAG2934356.1 hypothetical protein PC117_g12670 [Phytophthora cactorum]KAG3013322.1 hypothetical protein PC120_g13364 [Phytophthora cactorum]KAG3161189.1 hypothetical protein C6341_g13665 [Phytophthora cactorum]